MDAILVQQRGMLGIAAAELDCDYYEWLGGSTAFQNAYRGEYMAQYSWSETTNAMLAK